MSRRRKIPSKVLTALLVRSARRCCLCFGLRGDFSEKKGQVAHIDQNPANHSERNLAFLCLEHHDEFDSSPSQSKGITKEEVRFYRDKLYAGVEAKFSRQGSENQDGPDELATVRNFLESVSPDQPFRSSILNGYEIQTACERQLLKIEPFSSSLLTAAGYRLSCGEEAVLDGRLECFTKKRPLVLEPGTHALLSTQEIVSLPLWLLGKLNPHQASTLRHGLFTDAPGTVDPGFQGGLIVGVQNRGMDAVRIAPGLPLVKLELCLLNMLPRDWSPEGRVSGPYKGNRSPMR